MNIWTCTRQGELYHHGIKGQKRGVRRFQNKDGSLTPAGEKRYGDGNPINQAPKQQTKKPNSIDGTKVYNDAVQPIITLNAKKTLKEIGVTKLSDDEMFDNINELEKYMDEKYKGKRRMAL